MSWLKLNNLKKIRVVVALIIFIPTSILFIDPTNNIPSSISNILVSLQFIPSLMMILVYSSLISIGLIFIIGLTAAFGRVYCSTFCPLGTLQDIIIYIEKKIHKRKRFEYRKTSFSFHYFVLILTAIFAVLGNLTLLNLLEPFSNYGRILTNTIEPVFTLLNNMLTNIFGSYQLFYFYNIPLRTININVLISSFFFLILVIYMSYKHGRLFCNSLCPAGAILGLISRLSIYKLVINHDSCNECGACEKVCKANCIESKTRKIDFVACINCFNCIKSCPTDAVVYSHLTTLRPTQNKYDSSRRKFFKEITPALGLIIPLPNQKDSANQTVSSYTENKKHPIVPPGSKNVDYFTNLCTACHLCVSVCPTQVLYPTFWDYGVTGIFQPKMNYDASYCNYECTVCSQICPSGAIIPVDVEAKKLIQIGKACFVKEDCVVVEKKKDCAACSEHCPTKAVYMVQYEGKLKIPELNNDICVGCGACEHACPTTPRKAIFVKSNRVHAQAKKPKVQKQEKIFDSKQDFPF